MADSEKEIANILDLNQYRQQIREKIEELQAGILNAENTVMEDIALVIKGKTINPEEQAALLAKLTRMKPILICIKKRYFEKCKRKLESIEQEINLQLCK